MFTIFYHFSPFFTIGPPPHTHLFQWLQVSLLTYFSGYKGQYSLISVVTSVTTLLFQWLQGSLLTYFSGCKGHYSFISVVTRVTTHLFQWLQGSLLTYFSGCKGHYSLIWLVTRVTTLLFQWLQGSLLSYFSGYGYGPCKYKTRMFSCGVSHDSKLGIVGGLSGAMILDMETGDTMISVYKGCFFTAFLPNSYQFVVESKYR